MDRKQRTRAAGPAVLCALIAMLVIVPAAQAAGTSQARAVRPTYDGGKIRLVGVGGYRATGPHVGIDVTVCLQKRSGPSFVDVLCNSNSTTGNRVAARVDVPGCVKGAWRTTAFGQALTRKGTFKLQAYDASAVYRCA